MTLVNAETGELVEQCTEAEARALTDSIRATADALWSLLLEAHERRAWAALGYDRWEDYVATEFDMSRSNSYRLLDQARVVREIETAVAEVVDVPHAGHVVAITQRDAEDIKPSVGAVTEGIKNQLAAEAVENLAPERVAEIVNDEVAKARIKAAEKRKDREELAALEAELQPDGFDPELDRALSEERGKLRRLCRDLSTLPDPADLIEKQHDYLDRLCTTAEVADKAYAWLDGFLAAMEEHR
jgi:hypothetical protein